MPRSLSRTFCVAAILALALFVAACGGSDDEETATQGANGEQADRSSQIEQLLKGTAAENDPNSGKRGGKITVLSAGDMTYTDTGITYYTYDAMILSAAHRTLYAYRPDNASEPVPDLAEAAPEIAEDGKTVTVKIRQGVRFSPPVNREVTSADVKYAIERGFSSNVSNPYLFYFSDLVGAPAQAGRYREIPGIETPDDQTIVFRLKRGTGAVLAGALGGLMLSAPVPKEYAQRFDRRNPSTYGEHQVATGPYMFENDAQGNVTGYEPGRLIRLVRNPNYQKAGDFRPAYIDEWEIRAGNDDTTVSARRILAGQSLISGDGGAGSPAVLRQALTRQKKQISLKPSGAFRFISLDTQQAPFDDLNVRKAVIAGSDRTALRQQRGGELLGPIAQHYLPPGIPGHEESGGLQAPGNPDFMANPKGDPEVSAKYFKAAGFASGKYEGNETVLIVGDNADPDRSIAEVMDRQLQQMGFKTRMRLLSRDTMFTRYCNDPQSGVDVCPSVGWAKDFADPQPLIDPVFNGENILDTGNSNWSELDVPALNEKMDQAKLVSEPEERARVWADINKDVVAQAPGIPYVWDMENIVGSANVNLIHNQFNTTADLNFTSLK